MKTKLHIAIINIMPDVEKYHGELLDALSCVADKIEVHWIRLENKSYASDSQNFLAEHYQTFHHIKNNTILNAIIISGAPVELLDFDKIIYWQELSHIILTAFNENIFTLGLCWGALAIGQALNIEKVSCHEKVFGVFEVNNIADNDSGFRQLPQTLSVPFSIRAQFCPIDVSKHVFNGHVNVIASVKEMPHAILQTPDLRHLMCLGHPEYGAHRLIDEWNRDNNKQLQVAYPIGLDISFPEAHWRSDSFELFNYWVGLIGTSLVADRRTAK